MSAYSRRGACPALSEPMQTGDGLLVRLNPISAGLTPQQLTGLANAAARHGNGLLEVTARGNLQIRGLTAPSAAMLAAEVNRLGIAVRGGVLVQTGPLAGLDAAEIADPAPLAEAIRQAISAAGLDARLGPKVSVVVDGGGHSGLENVSADVRLEAVGPGRWRLAIAGDAERANVLAADEACAAALHLLDAIADLGINARAKDLRPPAPRSFAPPSGLPAAWPSRLPRPSFGPPARGEISQLPKLHPSLTAVKREPASTLPISPLAGEMAGRPEGGARDCEPSFAASFKLNDGRFASTVVLPFGSIEADQLLALADLAAELGIADLRLAPRRSILALCPSPEAAGRFEATAASLGFITTPTDPRLRLSACAGAPACNSGYFAARAIAAEIAAASSSLPFDIHVSGCAKGCAHPARATLTIVGSENGAGFVVNGTARDTPIRHVGVGRVAGIVAELAGRPGPLSAGAVETESAGRLRQTETAGQDA